MRRNERILDERHASEHYGRSSVRTAVMRELAITRNLDQQRNTNNEHAIIIGIRKTRALLNRRGHHRAKA
jgi:hypothetical protein